MSRTCTVAGDGKTLGGVCDIAGKCDSTINLQCNADGYCILSTDGHRNSPCMKDGDCKDYPGLKCKQDDPNKQGKCDCTTQSNPKDKCDENMICVGGDPSPGPSPAPQDWPQDFAYDTSIGNKFTGLCSATTSDWYQKNGGNCPSDQAYLTGLVSDKNVRCIPNSQWSIGQSSFYTQLCAIPKKSR
jgi:hypothetical protein